MKVYLFSIIALSVFSIVLQSEAIPWSSEEMRADDADSIAVGQIMSYQDDGAHRYYEISIIRWIKNPQQDQIITMSSITPKVFDPHNPYVIFEKKDLGLFYLKSDNEKWRSTNYSRQIWASELNQVVYDMKKLVGNNNANFSITLERTCNEGYVNAVKNRTGEIACVKPETKIKLIERGWALNDLSTRTGLENYDHSSSRQIFTNEIIIPKDSSNPELKSSVIPHTLTVVLGINSTVIWTNLDDVSSTIVADDQSWTTGLIKPDTSVSIVFNHTGVFGYHGEPHPWQKGTIMVYRGDNPSEKEILSDFQSKLITQEQAMKIVQGYIQQYNVTMSDSQDPNFHSVSDLTYVTLGGSGSFSRMEVNATTGIPEIGISPWWIDLEKSYIGLPSNRNENGFVAWVIVFRTCDNCVVPSLPTFVVDAVTGKVVAEPRYFDLNQQYK